MVELSVIICTYKREEYILKAFNSLINQTAKPEQYEIIIVNNNSPDNTDQICQNFIAENKSTFNIKYTIEYNPGLSFARNKGFKLSSGKYIAYMDNDAIAFEDYVENLIASFKSHPEYQALGGKVLPIFPNNKEPKWLSKYLDGIVAKVDLGDKPGTFSKKYPVGCNMAFKREVIERYGGFNTEITVRSDDKYMFYKLKKNHVKILYAPLIVVKHHIEEARLTPQYIKNQSYQIGYGEKIRLKNEGVFIKFKKFAEYCFKLGASLLLFLLYLAKGQTIKGVYIVKIICLTFLGYLFVKPNRSV